MPNDHQVNQETISDESNPPHGKSIMAGLHPPTVYAKFVGLMMIGMIGMTAMTIGTSTINITDTIEMKKSSMITKRKMPSIQRIKHGKSQPFHQGVTILLGMVHPTIAGAMMDTPQEDSKTGLPRNVENADDGVIQPNVVFSNAKRATSSMKTTYVQ